MDIEYLFDLVVFQGRYTLHSMKEMLLRGTRSAFAAVAIGAYSGQQQDMQGGSMRALERLLVKYTIFLCNLIEVTPQHLENLRRKKQRPLRPEERYDYFEA